MTTASNRPPIMFGETALTFVREELLMATEGFEGPLAARLLTQELGTVFGFTLPDRSAAAPEWRHGGVDDGTADQVLAGLISRWLGRRDAGRRRVLLLEEPLGRYSDPATHPTTWHFGDRIYHVATTGSSPVDVRCAFGRLSGYPGIGLLGRPVRSVGRTGEIDAVDLDALVADAAAVLVRAWDDEAFMVAGVAGRLDINDFAAEWQSGNDPS